jgi:hypothetical protein
MKTPGIGIHRLVSGFQSGMLNSLFIHTGEENR